MELKLVRTWLTEASTIGVLYVNGATECFTLELPWKDNLPDVSCIPAGTYDVLLQFSPRFNRIMPHLQAVPNREDILLHWGNFPADTEGCILVGEKRGNDSVLDSVEAFSEFFPKLQAAADASEPITITVVNPSEWPAP